MKKTLKKISALVLALAMIVAMGATVFAANTDDDPNDWNGIEIESEDNTNTIGIAKQIVFINGETTDVREPNITYKYTIATTTPGTATVTDHNDITGTVKPGPMAAVSATTATVAFADTTTAAANSDGTGTADIKYANFTFTPASFGAAGIYRYMITESSIVTKASVGVTEAPNYVNTRYLDVYVSKTSNIDPTLKIYGYVLFEGSATDSINYATAAHLAKKSAGFVNKSKTTGSQEDVDVYTTENIEISKTITGVMADTTHNFPLAIELTAPTGVTTAPKVDVTVTNGGTVTDTLSDAVGTYVTLGSLSGTVTNTSTIKLSGLPIYSTVKITETNNTPDSYKVKATSAIGSADATELIAEVTVATDGTATHNTAVIASDKVTIAITNTLDAISPTGVVLRFGPYALMLAGGLALLILAMRRRSLKDED